MGDNTSGGLKTKEKTSAKFGISLAFMMSESKSVYFSKPAGG